MTARPAAPPHPTSFGDVALARAAVAAADVGGAYADSPVAFWPLDGGAARLVESLRDGGRWILVTCRRSDEPGHAAHLYERSLTAAQRFSLSLWIDGLDAVWIQDGLPAGDTFRAAGLAIGLSKPVGLVWVSGTTQP